MRSSKYTPQLRICSTCGKEFMSTYGEEAKFYGRGIPFNCSVECKKISRAKRISEAKLSAFSDEEYRKEVAKKHEVTCLERYGVSNTFLAETSKAKAVETSLRLYGTAHPASSKIVRERIKKTCLERYGKSTPFSGGGFNQEKVKATQLSKYGAYPASRCSEVRSKMEKTCLERYGVSSPFKSDDILNKCVATQSDLYGDLYAHKVSQGENEVFEFLRSLGAGVSSQVRGIVPRGRVDMVIEDSKLCVEFNGDYWHSDVVLAQKYHLSLREAQMFSYQRFVTCREAGYDRYFIVWQHLWNNNVSRVIVKSMLTSLVGRVSDCVYARNCVIKELSSVSEFLTMNHIQGVDNAFRKFGLVYNGDLVSVMTFRRSRNNQQVELSRFCSKLGLRVVGGFSKLFKYAISVLNVDSIFSFSDNSYSNGDVYFKNGWELVEEIPPDYHIFYRGKVYHKSSFRKSELFRRFPDVYNSSLTEWQMEDKIGALRIWDCGKKRWKYVIK